MGKNETPNVKCFSGTGELGIGDYGVDGWSRIARYASSSCAP